MTMIVIHNSDGSVCCRTSNEKNCVIRCKDKYREEDQEDMLTVSVLNFKTGEIEYPSQVQNATPHYTG